MRKTGRGKEFSLHGKTYGHSQLPAVIPAESMPKAQTMSDMQFDSLYLEIKRDLGAKWCREGSLLWLREQEEKANAE
jgi:hypothetical protein